MRMQYNTHTRRELQKARSRFNKQCLGSKLDEHSHIFSNSTGAHGTNPPNYEYANLKTWSGRIAGGLLSTLLYIFVFVQFHQNILWLTMFMCIEFPDKVKRLFSRWGHNRMAVTHARHPLLILVLTYILYISSVCIVDEYHFGLKPMVRIKSQVQRLVRWLLLLCEAGPF
eukprot:scaffold15300_cov78-Skeletonema_dohrnii-CCMP3373.AAC.1